MATVRIYKFAELLDTTSQEVLALLKRDHGIELKSASSTIEEVVVEDKQLSLAIGKKGQNVRLAAKLTGWRIDIKSEEEKRREVEAQFGDFDAAAGEGAEADAAAGDGAEADAAEMTEPTEVSEVEVSEAAAAEEPAKVEEA